MTRADLALVQQGLARSRAEACALIQGELVLAQGDQVRKPAQQIPAHVKLELIRQPGERPYASRAGPKLGNALEALRACSTPIVIRGAHCVDLGASHGGFTDVLLRELAAQVVAVDVGRGQLDAELRADQRVVVMDQMNVRDLRPGDLPQLADLVVADLSFISLRLVLPKVAEILRPGGQALLLVKPQFEVGKGHLGSGGVVRDPCLQEQSIREVAEAATVAGLLPWAIIPASPRGAGGNREFFLALDKCNPKREAPTLARLRQAAPEGPHPALFDDAVAEAVRDRSSEISGAQICRYSSSTPWLLDDVPSGSAPSRRVLLVTHGGNPVARAALIEARVRLEETGFEVLLHDDRSVEVFGEPESADLIRRTVDQCEVVIVLGGDGTILRAAEITYGTEVPILGINLGHVGFLAEAEREDLGAAMHRLATGDFQVEERTVAAVTVQRPTDAKPRFGWALNEATIEKARRQRLVEVGIEVDQRPLSSFGCDGVVIATATGSTAHAFSAGGPVMWPDLDGVLLVPLAAHALFARPLVIGPDSSFRVTVLPRSPLPAVLTCDGRRSIDLPVGSQVEVRTGAQSLKFARLSETSFTDRLVEKFNLPVIGWREAADNLSGASDPITRDCWGVTHLAAPLPTGWEMQLEPGDA